MKIIHLAIVILFVATSVSFAEQTGQIGGECLCQSDSISHGLIEKPDTSLRSGYAYMTIGVIEPLALVMSVTLCKN